MTYHNPKLISLLYELFGFPRLSSRGKKDLEYNCPHCDGGRNKFNLSIDVDNLIYHCWACGYKGKAHKLFKDFGNPRQILEFNLLNTKYKPEKIKKEDEEILSLSEFKSLKYNWSPSPNYTAAMKYLRKRNIDQEIINRWDICYSESGKYKNRIIIPSKSLDGKIDYFIARDFFDVTKLKYKNPRLKKDEVIFGEKFIDWNKPIIITEGVFDAIVIYNAIPILGTNIKNYKKLLRNLIYNKSTVILGFDADKTGKEKEIKVAQFLLNLGVIVYILPKTKYNEYNDLSEIYNKEGKKGIINLIKSAQPFDKLDAAIATL